MRLDKHFITNAVPEAEYVSFNMPDSYGFSIDSRTLQKNDIFIALKGNSFDGHNFIQQALAAHAAGLIINKSQAFLLEALSPAEVQKLCVILVNDTKQALIALAKAWRSSFQGQIIGITGSVGKTSTKERLSKILSIANIPHIASHANQNSRYYVALNVLRLRPEHAIGIFEMGINKRGEMAELADIVRPDAACITNIGHCHMEGLGSLADIASEKRTIFKFFKEDSIGIINGDQPLLSSVAYIHPVIKFGTKTTNQVQARKIEIASRKGSFVLKLYGKKYTISLTKGHLGEVFNCLAAASIAYYLTIKDEFIIKGLQEPLLVPGRFEERKTKSGKGLVISDCYNANPESMKTALAAFEHIETDAQKIAVLGDMLELGVNSPFWHRQLGRFLRKVPSLRKVVLVGSHVKWTYKTVPIGIEVSIVPSWKEAVTELSKSLNENSLVFVKGSRGMQLNNIIEELC